MYVHMHTGIANAIRVNQRQHGIEHTSDHFCFVLDINQQSSHHVALSQRVADGMLIVTLSDMAAEKVLEEMLIGCYMGVHGVGCSSP